jgi:hypothetical protein
MTVPLSPRGSAAIRRATAVRWGHPDAGPIGRALAYDRLYRPR